MRVVIVSKVQKIAHILHWSQIDSYNELYKSRIEWLKGINKTSNKIKLISKKELIYFDV